MALLALVLLEASASPWLAIVADAAAPAVEPERLGYGSWAAACAGSTPDSLADASRPVSHPWLRGADPLALDRMLLILVAENRRRKFLHCPGNPYICGAPTDVRKAVPGALVFGAAWPAGCVDRRLAAGILRRCMPETPAPPGTTESKT